jgi:hypothetical protein
VEILLTVFGLVAAVTSIGLALLSAPVQIWLPIMLVAGAVGIIGGGGGGGGDDGWEYIRRR